MEHKAKKIVTIFFILILIISITSEPVSAGFFDDLWNGITGAFNTASEAITEFSNTIHDGITNIVDAVTNAVDDAVDWLVDVTEDIPVIGPVVETVSELVGGAVNTVASTVGAVVDTLAQTGLGIANLVLLNPENSVENWGNLGDSWANVADETLNMVGGVIRGGGDIIADLGSLPFNGIAALVRLADPDSPFADALDFGGGFIHSFMSGVFGSIGAAIETTGDWINGEGDWLGLFISNFSEGTVTDLLKVYVDVEEKQAHFKTGRIYANSLSDVSSYLARDIFYDELPKDNNILVLAPGNGPDFTGAENIMKEWWDAGAKWDRNKQLFDATTEHYGFTNVFGNDTYGASAKYEQDFLSSNSVFFVDHGGGNSIGVLSTHDLTDNAMDLPPQYFVIGACLSGSYGPKGFQSGSQLSTELLAHGTMNVVSSVDVDMNVYYYHELLQPYKTGESFGTAFLTAKNSRKVGSIIGLEAEDFSFILYGDPTIKPEID
jgi:hypothetical protein